MSYVFCFFYQSVRNSSVCGVYVCVGMGFSASSSTHKIELVFFTKLLCQVRGPCFFICFVSSGMGIQMWLELLLLL